MNHSRLPSRPFVPPRAMDPSSPASAPGSVSDLHLDFCAQTGNDALVDELATLAARVSAATCRLVLLAAELDRRGIWAAQYARSAAHWLSWRLGLDPVTGREYVRVGHALRRLPEVLDAFGSGSLSYSKVRALTRVASPGDGIDWVSLAATMSAARLERFVRSLRVAEVGHSTWGVASHHVTVRHDPDGSVVLQARLPADEGAMVLAAIDSLRDRNPIPPGDDASAEAPPLTPADPTADRRSALVRLARGHLEATNVGVRTRAPRPLLTLHVDADGAYVQDGGGVPAAVLRRQACDSVVTAVVHDRDGRAVDVGRRKRLVTERLRRLIAARDDHRCRFPGCERTRFLDAHHITHWIDGGRTDAANLLLLCDQHHRDLHDGAYAIKVGEGKVTFQDGCGRTIPVGAPERPVDPVDPLDLPWLPEVSPDALLPHLDTGDHRHFSEAVSIVATLRARYASAA